MGTCCSRCPPWGWECIKGIRERRKGKGMTAVRPLSHDEKKCDDREQTLGTVAEDARRGGDDGQG